MFHLANLDLPGEERATARELRPLAVAEQIVAANDVFAVLRAGSDRGWGVAVVGGAGVNAVGLHSDGRIARYLAIGELSGDWGGGLAVGLAALAAAVRAGDGRGPHTVLRERIGPVAGVGDPEELAVAIYSGLRPRLDLLDLAPMTLQAAHEGDPIAVAIIGRLSDEAAVMAIGLLRRLRLLRSAADVVLGGGMLQSGSPLIVDGVAARLHADAPNARVVVLDVPPVAGSLDEALQRAGASAAARRRAREFFEA